MGDPWLAEANIQEPPTDAWQNAHNSGSEATEKDLEANREADERMQSRWGKNERLYGKK
jgi:hypothetical protein